MAVTARFVADFASFQSAVSKAEVSLKGFESEAGRVEKSLNRIGDSFSGRKVIQDAELATKAIKDMGGVSTLTVREQEKLNASITEALAKYKALGIEAPKAMVDLANATAKVPDKLSLVDRGMNALKGTFGQVFGAFTAANLVDRAVTGLVNLGKQAVKAAGDTLDLANKTGLSTDTIQRMGFVAMQTGSSVDSFTRAAFMLGVNLEKGKGQVEGLGASFAELRALSPDKQFAEVVRRLEEMKNPQERNEVAVRLFGRAAQEILPSIAEGYTKIADQAVVAERAQLEAIDRASDAWDAFVKNTTTKITSWLGTQVMVAERYKNLTIEQQKQLFELQREGLNTAEALAKIFPNRDVMLPFEGAVKRTRQSTQELADALKNVRKEAEELVSRVNRNTDAETKNGMAVRRLTLDLLELVKSHRRQLDVLPPLIENYTYLSKALEDTRTPIERMNAALRESAKLMSAELARAQAEAHKYIVMAGKALEEEAKAAERLEEEILGLVDAIGRFAFDMGGPWGEAISNMAQGWLEGAAAAEQYEKATTKAGKAMAVVQGVNAVANATSGKSRGASVAGGALAGAQAGAMFGPYGMAVGAVGGAIVGFIRSANNGRKAAVEFAKSFGGFDSIQKRLESLPKHGDALWRALTQGSGDTTDAINAVTEAFRLQEEAMNTTTPSFAEASAAAEKLGLDITKIGDGLNDLRVMDSGKDIAAQWEILRRAGADMEQVATGAADKFQVLVDEALRWGHKLPEEMRAPLQKMADMGLLTDDAGEKLEDLSGIKFAKPLEAAIDGLISKLDELIAKISGGVGGALRSLPSVNVGIEPMGDRGGIDPDNHFAGGSGGFRNFGRGTPAMLHGWEAVVRPQDMAGPSQIVIPVSVGDRHVETIVVDVLSRVVQRRGLVSAA